MQHIILNVPSVFLVQKLCPKNLNLGKKYFCVIVTQIFLFLTRNIRKHNRVLGPNDHSEKDKNLPHL